MLWYSVPSIFPYSMSQEMEQLYCTLLSCISVVCGECYSNKSNPSPIWTLSYEKPVFLAVIIHSHFSLWEKRSWGITIKLAGIEMMYLMPGVPTLEVVFGHSFWAEHTHKESRGRDVCINHGWQDESSLCECGGYLVVKARVWNKLWDRIWELSNINMLLLSWLHTV